MRVDIEKTAMIWPSLAEAMDEDHSGLPMGEVIPRRRRAIVGDDIDQLPSVSPGAAAGEHHQGGRDTGGAAHQGLLAGGREPHHRQLPSHQPRADAGAGHARRR
jgi:exodeoxyribonuclease V alpha subunit